MERWGRMNRKLREKIRESLQAVVPVTAIVFLPKLKKGMKWYKVCDSTLKEPFYDTPVLCENQQYADVSPQSVYILIGR